MKKVYFGYLHHLETLFEVSRRIQLQLCEGESANVKVSVMSSHLNALICSSSKICAQASTGLDWELGGGQLQYGVSPACAI